MLRALSAGVSGLRAHLARLDVIGNNIANVNTVAFKGSRVTFEEAFTQVIRGAARPTAGLGGTNPMQIGLGVGVGSIDTNFAQGNLESTGQMTDLAIQGDAFFVVGNGARSFYTRAGNFQLDADGRLVAPTNGFVVQGLLANSDGELLSGTVGDIVLPFGQRVPARETSEVVLRGNLDTRAEPLGTILTSSGRLLAIEQSVSNGGAGSDVSNLYASGNANAQISGMSAGGTTITVSDGTTTRTYTYVAADTGPGDLSFRSLNDLVDEINTDFGSISAAMDDTTGELTVTAAGAPVTLSLSSTNAVLNQALSAANGALAAAATASTDEFSHVANQNDLVANLRDSAGASLGITAGESLLIDGQVGGVPISQSTVTVGAGTTYAQLAAAVETALGLQNADGAAIDTGTGALRITGDGGTSNALTGLTIRSGTGALGFDGVFGTTGAYVEEQEAIDISHAVAITVFDSLGNPNIVTLEFTKDPITSNRWLWQATVPSPAIITAGGSGAVTFGEDGRLESFSYDGGATSMQFDPTSGARALDINLRAGTLGDVDGLSQFASPSNAVAASQDGYTAGDLDQIVIDDRGVITGFFTNGINQTLAQIALAGFNNPSGMLRAGDNMYQESANSGEPILGFSGGSNQSTITPGALEMSNVDLSREFTAMIIAQRGFQANARVISTADEMLTELVNLAR